MSKSYLISDLKAACRAFELILKQSLLYQKSCFERKWDNSSVRSFIEEQSGACKSKIQNFSQEEFSNAVKESYERASMVAQGIKVYAGSYPSASSSASASASSTCTDKVSTNVTTLPKGITPDDLKASELHHKDKELIEKLEKEHEQRLQEEAKLQRNKLDKSKESLISEGDVNFSYQKSEQRPSETNRIEIPVDKKVTNNFQEATAKKFVPKKQQLPPEAKQRKVPSSRIGRMISFGSLAAGLGVGALAEATRRTLDISLPPEQKSISLDQLFLTEANAERIVSTLCRVRGAALKIGQILSIQDNTVINPVLQKAFERVRHSADFMPSWQVHKVLVNELGPDWRSKLSEFEEKPFAAASIGQVHHIQLKDGRHCAMKIQYPGVAQGIESDINNLIGVMKIWNVFPEGLFIDNLVEVAKRELAWEVDYIREAEATKKFKKLLEPYPDYIVPDVIDELSTGQIFTSTIVEGVPVDQCVDMAEEHRERAAQLIMQLCLREVFDFRYMQTDPNWSNFFYDPNAKKLSLLDFGATRSYEYEFVKKYIEVIKAAADGDRDKVLKISQEMGFLTGYESKNMEKAHVNAVMILAEVFSSGEAFDFGQQDTTARIQKLVPTIVTERLCPPPEEIYSLHRKLSGVFLLCAKLKVKLSCREMFLEVYRKFKEASVRD